jgi:hypothetical protein
VIALALALLGFGAALVVLAPSSGEPQRVASEPVRVSTEPMAESSTTWVVIRQDLMGKRIKWWPWSCGRGDQIPIPTLSEVLPAGVTPAALGPIAQTVDVMIEIVKQIFAELGWRRRCTVRGGEFAQLAIVQRGASPRKWSVEIMGRYLGDEGQILWRYEGETDDTLTLTMVEEKSQADWSEPARLHMTDGRIAPPDGWWPHGNMQQWRPYGDDAYVRRPFATVSRPDDGDSLVLGVWLPPRAPVSKNDIIGRRTIERSVAWKIEWKVT